MRFLSILLIMHILAGCSSMFNSATRGMAEDLSKAMLDQDDPELVKAAIPAYLLMIDSLNLNDDGNTPLKLSAAKLYGAYASAFVEDPTRAKKLSQRSLDYARVALCNDISSLCPIESTRLENIQTTINKVPLAQQAVLYRFAVSWAGWLQSHSDDWNAIAQIPKLEALFKHSIQLDEQHDRGGAYLYLGVLGSQLPPSLGGKPDLARQHFERAIELSQQQNLMAKVLMAEHYARLVFDQVLHDRLLNEVLSSPVDYPELTLLNTLAQQRARVLLDQSTEFF